MLIQLAGLKPADRVLVELDLSQNVMYALPALVELAFLSRKVSSWTPAAFDALVSVGTLLSSILSSLSLWWISIIFPARFVLPNMKLPPT